MRKLSLFSGVGGIDLAAHWAGMETVAFCEREPFPVKVLQKNFPGVPIYDDVCTLTADRLKEDGIIGDGRTIDIISGGFPCQPFSHAGKREGTSDDRYLWTEIVRILEEVRPTWFVGENVAGLISMEQSDSELIMEDDSTICEEAEMVLETIKNDLENIGYQPFYVVIPSSAVGAPHRRDRIFIVAYTESQPERGLPIGESAKITGSACGCENVADTQGERSRETRKHQCAGSQERTSRCGEDVAYPSGSGIEECNSASISNRQGHCTRSSTTIDVADTYSKSGLEAGPSVGTVRSFREPRNNACGCGGTQPTRTDRWSTESELGGILDGLSSWLDGYRWPAGQGAEQYDWEPRRVTAGETNRTGRLKALGNAVNPVQIYPIMAAIKAINDQL
ncbi:DNA (cytosine-5-)-methyltransferase [Paenibacillus sp. FSL K6-1318]|uniref:DNA cytosine methyltransferase n=1 Tax=Paenibacillus sp. FSL K6-1318 TaxID=2975291 RepID=UPI0030ED57B8